MIDTVCLLIPKSKVIMLDLSQRGGTPWSLQSDTEQYKKFVKNPSKRDLSMGLYFPRLTGYRRKSFTQEPSVRIEFSAPKLLYLNNLEELEDKDFSKVIEVLEDRLRRMGVVVAKEVLENASVSSVHFSKNIQLEDGYTVNYLISEMNKVNLQKNLDFTKARYINDGQSLCIHATSHEFIIYDKVADLSKDKKRAIDKEQTPYQRSLFADLNRKNELMEILRFEVRLNKKQKMNKVLEGLGYKKNPTFRDVFSAEISKKVVNHYWSGSIKEKSFGIFSMALSFKDILRILFKTDEKMHPKRGLCLLALFMLSKDENGMRQLRSIVSKRSHDRTWYRMVSDIKKASELITKNNVRDWVTQIDKKLEDYKPYKIKTNEETTKS